MQTRLFAAAAAAATLFLLPLPGRASFIVYTDNASNYASTYNGGNAGSSNPSGYGTGFGAFTVTTTNATSPPYAGVFLGSSTGSENGTANINTTTGTGPTPPTTSPQSFGFYANQGNATVTVTRPFATIESGGGISATGDGFSLDFVTGYNDNGTSGVALTTSSTTGANLLTNSTAVGNFVYNAASGTYYFNGTNTGISYNSGALHLAYSLTSPTAYSLAVTGAVSYSNTGTFSSPITGFEVQQNYSQNAGDSAHDGYFNNLDLTAAPEPSQVAMMTLMGLGLGGLILRAKKRQVSAE